MHGATSPSPLRVNGADDCLHAWCGILDDNAQRCRRQKSITLRLVVCLQAWGTRKMGVKRRKSFKKGVDNYPVCARVCARKVAHLADAWCSVALEHSLASYMMILLHKAPHTQENIFLLCALFHTSLLFTHFVRA